MNRRTPLTLLLVVVLWVSGLLVASPGNADSARQVPLDITTDPGMTPAFRQSRPDYVVRCSDAPITLKVTAPPGTKVGVGDAKPRSGSFDQRVGLSAGKAVVLTVTVPSKPPTKHWVRCLPSDFPVWTATQYSQPQAAYYAMSVIQSHYAILADEEGVPVWWRDTGTVAGHVDVLPNGHLLWATLKEAREVDLGGHDVHYLPGVAGGSDLHDAVRLRNGDYLILQYALADGVDRSAWGLGPGGVIDARLQRKAPDGTVLWTWSALDHLSLDETSAKWRSTRDSYVDAFHINSAEEVGDSYVLSFRHLDALVAINATTGDIEWKLGGTRRAESLSGAAFSGQHDARILPDGTLTLHDNRSMTGRPPRAARYRLDLAARTATLVEEVSDPAAPSSFCCGSARRLPGGHWVMSWGGTEQVAELDATGAPVLRMVMASGTFAYRALPVLPGVVTPEQLRAGMDAQAQ